MKTVGVRELKNRLSEYLREVKAGESILVTDRGEVVAELAPPGRSAHDPKIPGGLAALARRGVAKLPAAPDGPTIFPPQRPLRKGPTSQALLDEGRGASLRPRSWSPPPS
jgi:antitoxin (DNA-binding transcriptional repressor) of toxin-antitoxin stability system